MLRLVGFFALVLLLAYVLGHLPVVGPVFARTGCIGIWISAMILSWAFARLGERMLVARRDGGRIRQHLAVGTPHSHGKVGALYLSQGRSRKALPHLERAAEGEPDVAEWHYRLGLALLGLRRREEAVAALTRCVALEEEHAYGAAQLRLAEALTDLGRFEEAYGALQVFERNHGPSPESAYRRGLALKGGGRGEEARAAFAEVGRLASEAARYQRRSSGMWAAKARLAKLF